MIKELKVKRNKNGITLIALIVTIIILLILAGVTLSLVADNNGILEKAQNAVEVTNEASIKEDIQLAILEQMTEYYENYANLSATYPTVMDYVKGQFLEERSTSAGAKLKYDEESGKFEYTKDGQIIEVSIDEKGNVTLGNVEKVPEEPEKPVEKYTVTYDANGGEGELPASFKKKFNEQVTVDTICNLTKTGYTFLGWATTSDAKEAITEFTMPEQDVTLYAVWKKEGISASVIANNPSEYFGATVTNYIDGDEWQIFDADEEHIYLIAKGVKEVASRANKYGGTDGASSAAVIASQTTSNSSGTWKSYFGNKAQWVQGGPTIQQYADSYKKTHSSKYIEVQAGGLSYQVRWSDGSSDWSYYLPNMVYDEWNGLYCLSSYDFWIATAGSMRLETVMHTHFNTLNENDYNYTGRDNRYDSFRPLVCLQDDVTMIQQSDGNFIIN